MWKAPGARTVSGSPVSYWDSLAAIEAWRDQLDHRQAQRLGVERWYEHFELRVAKVERARAGESL